MVDRSTPQSKKRKSGDSVDTKHVVPRKASEAPLILHSSKAVTVHVGRGSGNQTFIVHEDLLVTHSEFLAAAMSKTWKEGQERSVSLPEDDAELFSIFYNFVQTGQTFTSKDGDYRTVKDDTDIKVYDEEWNRLADCWSQGQKLLSTSFKDAVTDALIAKLVECISWPLELQSRIYPKSSPTSAVRRLLVDIAVWKWEAGTVERRDMGEGWSRFFFDVAVALDKIKEKGRQGREPFYDENTCRYHEHGTDKPCYKTMFKS